MSTELEGQSIESQLADVPLAPAPSEPPPAPVAATAPVERRGNTATDAEDKRKRQALELQREFILSQRTSSPHRRTALEAALIDIEEKLSELGWTIHL
jgi:hypothetical protein